MDVLGEGSPGIFILKSLVLQQVSHLVMEVLLLVILGCHLLHHLVEVTHSSCLLGLLLGENWPLLPSRLLTRGGDGQLQT